MKHFNQLFHKNIIQKITIYGSVITLTGTDGTADITINDIPNKESVTFLTDLTTTAKNWVAANIEHYEYHGYSVSASSGVITVTPKSDWDTVNRINATIANLTEDLSGTFTGVFEPDFSKADIWDVTFTMDSTIANPKNSRDGDKMTLRVVGTGFYTLSWGDGWGSDDSLPYINTDVITIKVQQSNGVSFAKATFSWSSYWSQQPEVLFFGLYSEISGGRMPNKKSGATDYLTVAGSVGSETYQAPNTAPYIAADTDYIWFKQDGTQRTTTTAELVGYDLQRTPVRYDDDAPYGLRAIIILNAAVVGDKRDKLFLDMWLPVLWDNDLNANGRLKGNRVGQRLWTPEVVFEEEYQAVYDAMTNKPSDADAFIQNTLVKALVDGGIYAKGELFDLFSVHNDTEGLHNWISPGTFNPTKAVNAPTFEQYGGYLGSSNQSRWIKTNFIPSSDATKLSQNSFTAIIGVGSADDNLATNAPDFGAENASGAITINPRQNNNTFRGNANCWGSSSANTTEIAHFTVIRNNATQINTYINKSKITVARNSSTFMDRELIVCGYDNTGLITGNRRRIRYLFVGAALTDAELGIFIDAMEAYLANYSKNLIA